MPHFCIPLQTLLSVLLGCCCLPSLPFTKVLSRQIAELGIYPAVDPLDSTSRMLDPRVIGDEHYETARATQKLLQDYKGLQVWVVPWWCCCARAFVCAC